ncbi:hypothetical protein [Staphylococcus xylosus]|uniref:hypothetical protein n=1 Tax=Staphylococcus xylosus TaxID=1288 RepID=UPI0015C55044|nr:hypothetical protein [Staphylococcus xylosus]NQD98375.1 hypothetical protein [Staphylococcus xylosus]
MKKKKKIYNYLEMIQVLKIREFILTKKHMDKRLNSFIANLIEPQALQAKDIDFQNKTININGTVHWIKHEKSWSY